MIKATVYVRPEDEVGLWTEKRKGEGLPTVCLDWRSEVRPLESHQGKGAMQQSITLAGLTVEHLMELQKSITTLLATRAFQQEVGRLVERGVQP